MWAINKKSRSHTTSSCWSHSIERGCKQNKYEFIDACQKFHNINALPQTRISKMKEETTSPKLYKFPRYRFGGYHCGPFAWGGT